jgi:hypothetical protein
MITYDPKNWLRILRDIPRSRVFRTLASTCSSRGRGAGW